MLLIFLKQELSVRPSGVSYTSFSPCSGGPTVRRHWRLTRDSSHQSIYDYNVFVPSGLHLRALIFIFFPLVLAGVNSLTFQAITSLVLWQVASSTLVADHPEVKGPVAL